MIYGYEISTPPDRVFWSSWSIFCTFTPLTAWKKKLSKTWKKTPGDIIILHKCTKNHDHRLYCSWDMARDRCNCYFFILGYFLPFYPSNCPKNKNERHEKKKQQQLWRYLHFTQVYQKSWLYAILFLRYGMWQM